MPHQANDLIHAINSKTSSSKPRRLKMSCRGPNQPGHKDIKKSIKVNVNLQYIIQNELCTKNSVKGTFSSPANR